MKVMNTDIGGQIFISYRRLPHREQEAVDLMRAMRDRGIPTWRDVDDLQSKPTEDELTSILNSPDTAGAVMLIASEVADSAMIRNVEAPNIFKRSLKDEKFIVLPVIIGIEYEQANSILNQPAGLQDLSNWNLKRIKGDKATNDQLEDIANILQVQRLERFTNYVGGTELEMKIFTRQIGNSSQATLLHDFTEYFCARKSNPNAYHMIESALKDTAQNILSATGGVKIIASGNAPLPLGVLIGSIFSPLANHQLSWMQSFAGDQIAEWSLSQRTCDVDITTRVVLSDPGSEEIVIAVGVSANIEQAVSTYIEQSNLNPRAVIYAEFASGPVKQGVSIMPEEGLSFVLQVIDKLREVKDNKFMKKANVHLFQACPIAMSVLLGQKLNTFSNCTVYEHTPTGKAPYIKVHTFQPSDF
tara:strand:+ start:3724 stop:4968 length:1245 start_codon:yes stop_codon:yes gene_type:complete